MSRTNILHRPFRYAYFHVTEIIAFICFILFLPQVFFPQIGQIIQVYGGLSALGCFKYNMWWQPVTYMFIHSGWRHIVFNMIGLLCFGITIERRIGSKEFILFYFLCGIFDGIISLLIYKFLGINTLLVGASGAIYSLLLLYAVMNPHGVILIWGIIPVHAPMLILIYTVLNILEQLFGYNGVANLTHLTGFIMAILYIMIRMQINPFKVWKNAFRR